MMSEQNGPEREVDIELDIEGIGAVAKLDCWRSLIDEARRAAGDQGAIVATTLSDAEMDRKFDAGFGLPEGVPFALWTEARVYFPACYDGSEWVASAPRNPCSETIEHVG